MRARGGRYEIANPIYAEVLPRALTYAQQMASWDERLTNREVEHRGKRVHVVGC